MVDAAGPGRGSSTLDDFHAIGPYSLDALAKREVLSAELLELTGFHREHCPEYRNILDALGYDPSRVGSLTDLPFLPVRIFKELDLLSIDRSEIFKTMTSSGTTGQAVSRIYLDKANALLQQKVFVRLLGDYVGKQRLPMLIVDCPATVRNRQAFSARGAAIIGLNVMARETTFALRDDMSFDQEAVRGFLTRHQGQKFLVFGFTFMVWQHFYQELLGLDERFDLSQAWLLQSGGWKRMQSQAITRELFKLRLQEVCGLQHFLDHYAMVEQTGSIYAECEFGHLHASIYSDIILRRPGDFSPCDPGETGLVQLVSVVPRAYPGHSLLSEDEGRVLGEDDCPCGRKGKYFEVLGRIQRAELRGCSDTYAARS